MQIEHIKLQELRNDQNGWGREEGTRETSKEEMSVDLRRAVRSLATLVSFSYNLKTAGERERETFMRQVSRGGFYWGKGLDRGRERIKGLPASLGELGKREEN